MLCPQGHIVPIKAPAGRVRCCPRCGAIFTADPVPDPRSMPIGYAGRPQRPRSRDADEDEEDRPRRRPRDDDDDDDDEPRSKRRAHEEEEDEDEGDVEVERHLTRKQTQMARVRLGIVFHMIKLGILLAALLFMFITLPVVLFLLLTTESFWATVLLHVTYNLGITAAPVFGIVGSILCGMCPPRSEARGMIIVSLIFDTICPFLGLFQLVFALGVFITFDPRVERLVLYMYWARIACVLTAWWLFQLYLRKMCFYMKETLLASESLNVIVHLLMATTILPTLVVATLVVFAIFPGSLTALILFLVSLAYLIFFAITFPIRQFRLLIAIRQKAWDKFLKPDD
jgi:hypothetical protein